MINPYGTIVEDMKCICGIGYNATLSAYYPDFESEDVSDYTDMQGKKLHSLQVLTFSIFKILSSYFIYV